MVLVAIDDCGSGSEAEHADILLAVQRKSKACVDAAVLGLEDVVVNAEQFGTVTGTANDGIGTQGTLLCVGLAPLRSGQTLTHSPWCLRGSQRARRAGPWQFALPGAVPG
eukprot:CAMPEP_0179016964 /NCGR_PEP_ID=MMETSP0796-20121207/3597_1 /TAXON_ID=73915 /ORGANISM="Pyrodinium bahamense, Strain pbaha01" /LENGTH=109 /DNA_ID=CAMNT_0020712683 /DNA_START=38 /DNA_END=364 /DNA_ORIENTATION=-